MIRRAAPLALLILALSPAESGICADSPGWFPANPLQPAGRPRAGDPAPKAAPSFIPAAPAPEPIFQQPAPTTTSTAPAERPRALSCEDTCSQSGLKIIFTLERGRIGSQSRVELESGEAFDMLAYAESCPHAEGKEIALATENVPDGCLFVFSIPSVRAVLTGAKARHDLRCSAGKIGMSGFHCNESTSPSSSFTSESFYREP